MTESQMPRAKHALLVIDVQDSFYHTSFWSDAGFATYQANQLALILAARRLP